MTEGRTSRDFADLRSAPQRAASSHLQPKKNTLLISHGRPPWYDAVNGDNIEDNLGYFMQVRSRWKPNV